MMRPVPIWPGRLHRRTLVAGALHDAGITDLDSGDPMFWVAEQS